MRRRAGIEIELASRTDQGVLRCSGHVEKIYEYRIARKVLMAEVSRERVRGRPRLALGNRGMMVEEGCSSMRERLERVERSGTYVTE